MSWFANTMLVVSAACMCAIAFGLYRTIDSQIKRDKAMREAAEIEKAFWQKMMKLNEDRPSGEVVLPRKTESSRIH